VLRDSQKVIDLEVGKRGSNERASKEAFGNPGGNSVSDLGTVQVGGLGAKRLRRG
jgi:hypothetical protein